jgi:hypothetical protein
MLCAGCIFTNDTSSGSTGRWEAVRTEYFPLNPVGDNSAGVGVTSVFFVILQVRHERDPLLYYMEAAATHGQRTLTTLRNIGIVLLAIGSLIQCLAIFKLLKNIIARRVAPERSVPAHNTPVMADDSQIPSQDSSRVGPAIEPMV